jgi:sarcosine oxidase gamma subunit
MSPYPQQQSQDLSERTASKASISISKLLSLSSDLQRRRPTAAATVAGDMIQPPKLGEIYINSDGKRVRRVVRQKSNASDASVVSSAENSVGGSVGGGEVYINAEGKKVRRVIKSASTASVGSVFSTPTLVPKKAQSIAEGEIYVRADGKRVRRVKRNASTLGASASVETSSATGTGTAQVPVVALDVAVTKELLTGFLANHSGKPNPQKMVTGAATVAGDHFVASLDGGEVYMNAEGKKVRRVLKRASSATVAPSAQPPPALGKISQSILKERQTKPTSPASTTTTDAAMSNAIGEGEVYINAEGKKVRRVRRSPSGAGGALANHLLGTAKTSQPRASGRATVAGNIIQEGEIYIRADGKKVCRIRKPKHPTPNNDDGKTAPSDTKSSLQGFLKATSSSDKEKNAKLGSATIAWDHRDGEIVIRPDGKKVIRRYKKQRILGERVRRNIPSLCGWKAGATRETPCTIRIIGRWYG